MFVRKEGKTNTLAYKVESKFYLLSTTRFSTKTMADLNDHYRAT